MSKLVDMFEEFYLCEEQHLFLPHSTSKSFTDPLPHSVLAKSSWNHIATLFWRRGLKGDLNEGKRDKVEVIWVKKINVTAILLLIVGRIHADVTIPSVIDIAIQLLSISSFCLSKSHICYFVIPQSTMLQGIERYLKQAIVDKNASVSSASLVSALVS